MTPDFRGWCRTDPTVVIDGRQYGLTIGIPKGAKGHIQSVVVLFGAGMDASLKGEGHKVFGVPLLVGASDADDGISLLIEADGAWLCTIEVTPRNKRGSSWFGVGSTNVPVEAMPIETE